MTFNVNRRDGLFSIRQTATIICRLIVKFTPVIRKLYPDATDLHDALEAANAACEVIVLVIDTYREPGV